MSSFKLLHNNHEAEAHGGVSAVSSHCLVILRRLCETPLGSFLRVIVNTFHQNLEKMTSSVLSIILFNLWVYEKK